jgi:hypothetical protein
MLLYIKLYCSGITKNRIVKKVAVVMVGPTVSMRDRSEHWGGEVRLAK